MIIEIDLFILSIIIYYYYLFDIDIDLMPTTFWRYRRRWYAIFIDWLIRRSRWRHYHRPFSSVWRLPPPRRTTPHRHAAVTDSFCCWTPPAAATIFTILMPHIFQTMPKDNDDACRLMTDRIRLPSRHTPHYHDYCRCRLLMPFLPRAPDDVDAKQQAEWGGVRCLFRRHAAITPRRHATPLSSDFHH